MLKAKKRTGRQYSRVKRFAERCKQAYERDGDTCPISGMAMKVVNGGMCLRFRACDHLWPERYVRSYIKGADPHVLENLLTVHPSVHARKTSAERHLYAGDWVGFAAAVRAIGYDLERFARALAALKASREVKKPGQRSAGWHQRSKDG